MPFCNFFRRQGNLVAGFLGIRRSAFAITSVPGCNGNVGGRTATIPPKPPARVLLPAELNTIVKD